MEILDTIHAFWAYFYAHPVRCFLIAFAVILAFSLLYLAGKALVNRIRWRRWHDRHVWYIDGGGRVYIKDRTEKDR